MHKQLAEIVKQDFEPDNNGIHSKMEKRLAEPKRNWIRTKGELVAADFAGSWFLVQRTGCGAPGAPPAALYQKRPIH